MNEALLLKLKKGIDALEVALDEEQIERIFEFIELLIKWSKSYNLTAIKDPHDIITHHILDSLSIVPFIKGDRVVDVGSGAGLPGIPCAIALRSKSFTLVDSNGKKTSFIRQAIGQLKLENARVVQSRVEDFKPTENFNTLIVRAFSSIGHIIELSSHLLNDEGELLIMKGTHPKEELKEFNRPIKIYELKVPGLNKERHLVCIKRHNT